MPYPSLSMAHPSIPRSHLVKKCRQLLTKTVDVEPCPGPHCGAYRSFEETLKAALAHEVIGHLIIVHCIIIFYTDARDLHHHRSCHCETEW